jgi:hypothetical protein
LGLFFTVEETHTNIQAESDGKSYTEMIVELPVG